MLIKEDPFPSVATVNSVNVDLRALLNVKKKIKEKQEVWDTLGQPSGKFNYIVKYFKPPVNNIFMSGIVVPIGWKKENIEEKQIQGANRKLFIGRNH